MYFSMEKCPRKLKKQSLEALSTEPKKVRLPLSYYTYKINKINKKTLKNLFCEKNHGHKE